MRSAKVDAWPNSWVKPRTEHKELLVRIPQLFSVRPKLDAGLAAISASRGWRERISAAVRELARTFPMKSLGAADFVLGGTLLTACFVMFFHGDIWGVGWDSLNYLFGSPLDFYENCKKIRGGGVDMSGTPYPPSIYLIFAFWLFPLKLFGWITSAQTFPYYLTYWLKVSTTLVYAASGIVFYRLALEYSPSKNWAKYATAAWLTMPVALFSEFIFSQYDIFYVLLTLAGLRMFLRHRLLMASMYFGLAITFKYFPAFTFFPLLLLYEKRLPRIALNSMIFIAPTAFINLIYGHSPAFIEGVRDHDALERVYAATFDIGLSGVWNAYLLPTACAILCGVAYLTEWTEENRPRAVAYIWLVTSLVPFLLIYWHPQWVMGFAAPIVLTSLLQRNFRQWLLLDVVGMLFCIGTICQTFIGKADAGIFQGWQIGLDFSNAYLMADWFRWFGDHSLNVFYSGFCAYLVLQIVLKARLLTQDSPVDVNEVDYGLIRARFYVGLAVFLIPACWCIYRDLTGNLVFSDNFAVGRTEGGLFGSRVFEQPFIVRGTALSQVNVLLQAPFAPVSDLIELDVLDPGGSTVAHAEQTVRGSSGTVWHRFDFNAVPVRKNAHYRIRLTSPTSIAGTSVAWWSSLPEPEGEALVDGMRENVNFSYRIGFVR